MYFLSLFFFFPKKFLKKSIGIKQPYCLFRFVDFMKHKILCSNWNFCYATVRKNFKNCECDLLRVVKEEFININCHWNYYPSWTLSLDFVKAIFLPFSFYLDTVHSICYYILTTEHFFFTTFKWTEICFRF